MLEILIQKIGVPLLVWSAVIAVFFIIEAFRLWYRTRSVRREIARLDGEVSRVKRLTAENRRVGVDLAVVEEIQEKGGKLGGVAEDWIHALREHTEPYDDPEGGRKWFVTSPVEKILDEDVVYGRLYNPIEFDAVPGILTSLGLFGTFVAILLALLDLRVDPTSNTVSGINSLIEGLSGKFASSVVALFTSVVFVLWHRRRETILRRARYKLVSTLKGILPTLSLNRVLLDIQRESVKQSVSLSNISSDVVDRFVGVFRTDISPALTHGISQSMAAELQTELRPTLERVSEAMDKLTTTVSHLEMSKQESVVGELRELTSSMERSIEAALRDMGRQFSDALTGSAQGEFDNVAAALSSSAEVLQGMNEQFMRMQASLSVIIDEARGTTQDQLASGRRQAENMSLLMESLMVRLNEAASQNLESVSGALTSVVSDLAQRVNGLSDDLVRTVGHATAQSREVAGQVVSNAAKWSDETTKRLESLLESMALRNQDFEKAGSTLVAAQQGLHGTIEQNQQALVALSRAAEHVKAYTESLAGLGQRTEEMQRVQVQIATKSAESVQQLHEAASRHQSFLDEYRKVFEDYRGAFEQLDERVAGVLDTILRRMGEYNSAVEKNFQSIVAVANDYVPRMADTFSAQVTALGEQLDELSEVLERNTAKIRA